MTTGAFADRLTELIRSRTSAVVVGLDPIPELFPEKFHGRWNAMLGEPLLEALAEAAEEFLTGVIDAVADIVPAVKPQAACYERLGVSGVAVLGKIIRYARERGLLVILDAKRNDIQSTAEAYADAYLGQVTAPGAAGTGEAWPVDALTVNPYLGSDGVLPFIERAEKFDRGVFVLVRTSNPSSVELQNLRVLAGEEDSWTIADGVARKVDIWGEASVGRCGYSSVGAVLGATFPDEARRFRRLMQRAYFLVPGVGAQGGNVEQLASFFGPDGLGAIVASSRSLIYAYREPRWAGLPFEEATRSATQLLREGVERARAEAANV